MFDPADWNDRRRDLHAYFEIYEVWLDTKMAIEPWPDWTDFLGGNYRHKFTQPRPHYVTNLWPGNSEMNDRNRVSGYINDRGCFNHADVISCVDKIACRYLWTC